MPDSPSHRRYRPLLELGRGGTSRAYLAESLTAGVQKLVVLKLLNPELCANREARSSFQREAALSAHLNHPNTVYVFEVGEHEGTPAMVMEYLEGVALTRVLSHCGYRLSLPLRVYILSQVLAGLHHFHELSDFEGNLLGAVHRDVSPHNVIVLHESGVKLVGFGGATSLRSREPARASTTASNIATSEERRAFMRVGNIQYMAPELLRGEPTVDRRVDVYSAGVMLWEALARRPLWKGFDRHGIERALARGELPSLQAVAPDAPRELARVAARALSPNREARYATALLMQVALERAAHETVGVAPARDLVAFVESSFGRERGRRREQLAEARQAAPFDRLAPAAKSRSGAEPLAPVTLARFARRVTALSGPGGHFAWPHRAASMAAAVCGPFARHTLSSLGTSAQHILSHARTRIDRPRRIAFAVSAVLAVVVVAVIWSQRTAPGDGEPGASPPTAASQTGAPSLHARERERASKPGPGMDVRGAAVRAAPSAALAPPRASAPALAPGQNSPSEGAPDDALQAVESEPASAQAPAAEATPVRHGSVRTAALAGHCNPPFRLTEDGVKSFKPECFVGSSEATHAPEAPF